MNTVQEAGAPTAPADVDCCIAGCGPAGAMLGLLLARAGVSVTVLEKHGDFLRDFRGDTIHPSTLAILDDLGLAERFLQLEHSELATIQVQPASGAPVIIDLRRLPGRFPFIALMPQWDVLAFLTAEATRYPGFTLRMNAEVEDLIVEDGVVRGIRYHADQAVHELRALVTVGADGRSSVTRAAAQLPGVETAPPIDVLWFRLTRRPDEPAGASFCLAPGHIVGMFNRGDYWQVPYVIPKGEDARVRAAGLPAFRQEVARLLPKLADRVDELQDWDQVPLLTVRSDRLRRWSRPGYMAIGDAAHAMSPIGGVGINLAVRDAGAAAHVLWAPLRRGRVSAWDLDRVQRRRELPTRLVQKMQALLQDTVLAPTLAGQQPRGIPWMMRGLLELPLLREVPARVMTYGITRPHVGSPQLARAA